MILYKEKETNIFWETFYPYDESQGGGPVALRKVDGEFVKKNYVILKDGRPTWV